MNPAHWVLKIELLEKKLTENEGTRYSSTQQGKQVLKHYEQLLIVAHRSAQTVTSYLRSAEFLMDFHNEDPKDLEIDQIIDFLCKLSEVKDRNWRTIKIYVAGLRWY